MMRNTLTFLPISLQIIEKKYSSEMEDIYEKEVEEGEDEGRMN